MEKISKDKDQTIKAKNVSNDESSERKLVKHGERKSSFEKGNQDT